MENASKALVMAGGILLSLMIIGALILMFTNLTNYQNANVEDTRVKQRVEFNQQFETYDRKNVRGNDLYTLLNKVIDYNRRKTTEGTDSDEGQYIAYKPMTVKFTIDKEELTPDGINRLFTDEEYEVSKYDVSKEANEFESKINDKIDDIETNYGGEAILQRLCTGLTKIFIDNPTGTAEQIKNEKIEAIIEFNSAYGNQKYSYSTDGEINNAWNQIGPIGAGKGEYRKAVYTYYEYIMFKRAKFDCDNVEYDSETGRITKMEFSFNGKFQ